MHKNQKRLLCAGTSFLAVPPGFLIDIILQEINETLLSIGLVLQRELNSWLVATTITD